MIGRNWEAEVQLNSDWRLSAAAVHETARRLQGVAKEVVM